MLDFDNKPIKLKEDLLFVEWKKEIKYKGTIYKPGHRGYIFQKDVDELKEKNCITVLDYNESITEVKQKPVLLITNYKTNAQEFHNIQPYFFDEKEIFWFWQHQNSNYKMVDTTDIMNSVDNELNLTGETITSKVKANYLEAFKRVGRLNTPEEQPKHWIQFKNTIFDLEKKQVFEASHKYLMTNPIPWDIGITSHTPTMDKLFSEWVGEENKEMLYEIIAYCTLTDYPIHLLFCLIGSGRNGKSKYQGLIQKFLGQENIASTELDSLLSSRFESAKLYKKLVCSLGETNFGIISKTSLLKKLTGQDLIGYEFKNKKPFDDYNYAKIVISSNSLPISKDTSEGFYRRWLIVDFPNNFDEGQDILKTIPDIEYNNLAKKVTEILPKLLLNGKFTGQGNIQQRQQKYIESSNPISIFINKHCNKGYAEFCRYTELYRLYTQFLKENKKRVIKMVEFKQTLIEEGYEVRRTSKKIGTDKDGFNDFESSNWVEGISIK